MGQLNFRYWYLDQKDLISGQHLLCVCVKHAKKIMVNVPILLAMILYVNSVSLRSALQTPTNEIEHEDDQVNGNGDFLLPNTNRGWSIIY